MEQVTRLWPPRVKPQVCDGCPSKGSGFVPGSGNFAGRMLVIAMEPGTREWDEGEPLVGKTGEEVRNALGAMLPLAFLTNVRKCWHREDEDPKRRAASIDYCTENYLSAEIEKFEGASTEPATVLLLGDDAEKYWLGRTGIEKHHGSVMSRAEADAIARANGAPGEGDAFDAA